MSEPVMAQPDKKKKGFEDYEVDNACETLLRAEEIKKNEALMKEVRKKLTGKAKAIRSIADLREKANEVNMEEPEEEEEEEEKPKKKA